MKTRLEASIAFIIDMILNMIFSTNIRSRLSVNMKASIVIILVLLSMTFTNHEVHAVKAIILEDATSCSAIGGTWYYMTCAVTSLTVNSKIV